MTLRKFFLTAATIALGAATTFGSVAPSQALADPAPSPTPSPPPHGLNCNDGTNGPGWITGRFFIGNSSVTVNTSITVLPNTPDAREYLKMTEQRISGKPPVNSTAAPSKTLNLGAAISQITQQVQDSQTYAQLGQRLEPLTRYTTVDILGNWACHGLDPGTYLLLATTAVSPNQGNGNAKYLYYHNTVVYRQNFRHLIWSLNVPILTWQPIPSQS